MLPTRRPPWSSTSRARHIASWHQLFASARRHLPVALLKGKDRDAELKNGYIVVGRSVDRQVEQGRLDRPDAEPQVLGPEAAPRQGRRSSSRPNTSAEFQAFKSGQLDAIYPHPQLDVIDADQGRSSRRATRSTTPQTASVEALVVQQRPGFPFDSEAVRQAFGYAIDRDTIVKKLFGELGVDKAANSLNPYVLADYSDQDAWAGYKLDLDKVDSLMTGDGWEKGSDGIWAKDGKTASFTISHDGGQQAARAHRAGHPAACSRRRASR